MSSHYSALSTWTLLHSSPSDESLLTSTYLYPRSPSPFIFLSFLFLLNERSDIFSSLKHPSPSLYSALHRTSHFPLDSNKNGPYLSSTQGLPRVVGMGTGVYSIWRQFYWHTCYFCQMCDSSFIFHLSFLCCLDGQLEILQSFGYQMFSCTEKETITINAAIGNQVHVSFISFTLNAPSFTLRCFTFHFHLSPFTLHPSFIRPSPMFQAGMTFTF